MPHPPQERDSATIQDPGIEGQSVRARSDDDPGVTAADRHRRRTATRWCPRHSTSARESPDRSAPSCSPTTAPTSSRSSARAATRRGGWARIRRRPRTRRRRWAVPAPQHQQARHRRRRPRSRPAPTSLRAPGGVGRRGRRVGPARRQARLSGSTPPSLIAAHPGLVVTSVTAVRPGRAVPRLRDDRDRRLRHGRSDELQRQPRPRAGEARRQRGADAERLDGRDRDARRAVRRAGDGPRPARRRGHVRDAERHARPPPLLPALATSTRASSPSGRPSSAPDGSPPAAASRPPTGA